MFRYRSHPILLLAAILTAPSAPCADAWWQAAAASAPAHQQRVSYIFKRRGVAETPGRGAANAGTQTGIDVLEAENFASLRGKRLGLITNQTGVDSQGRRTADLLAHASGLKLVALFSPEHGISGAVDAPVANAIDPATQLPIYSLYGESRRPTPEMLKDIDVLVFDLQDAGVRFYTYITTMAYSMEAAAKNHISFVVLDRPNPLGGVVMEGPVLDDELTSFVGYFPMPVRYGMTLGELAKMFNAENRIGADLAVIAMKGWRRNETFSQTGVAWIAPSPNLRTPAAAFLYPGIEILQAAGLSVGRGTDTPFEILGAPWIHSNELADALNGRKIAGVTFAPAQFTPRQAPYENRNCEGVAIRLVDDGAVRPMQMGIAIAGVLRKLYPQQFQLEKMIALLGSQSTIRRLASGDDPGQIVAGWSGEMDRFRKIREKYLLYP
jgi:uncharacterized protein YbbC (DUF1343 family)